MCHFGGQSAKNRGANKPFLTRAKVLRASVQVDYNYEQPETLKLKLKEEKLS